MAVVDPELVPLLLPSMGVDDESANGEGGRRRSLVLDMALEKLDEGESLK